MQSPKMTYSSNGFTVAIVAWPFLSPGGLRVCRHSRPNFSAAGPNLSKARSTRAQHFKFLTVTRTILACPLALRTVHGIANRFNQQAITRIQRTHIHHYANSILPDPLSSQQEQQEHMERSKRPMPHSPEHVHRSSGEVTTLIRIRAAATRETSSRSQALIPIWSCTTSSLD